MERLKRFYAPLAAVLLVGLIALVAIVLLDDGEDEAESQTLDEIELVDERDWPDSPIETVPSDGWNQVERYKAALELEVQAQQRPTSLGTLETKVLKSAVLPPCVTLGDGGTVLGGGYPVVLPLRPRPGYTRIQRLERTVAPGESDRFRLVFETPKAPKGISALYELELTIRHRGSRKPVSLGRYVVMTPFTLQGTEWKFTLATGSRARQQGKEQEFYEYGPAEESLRCFRRNREAIAPLLASDGERAEGLNEMLEFVSKSSDVPVPTTP